MACLVHAVNIFFQRTKSSNFDENYLSFILWIMHSFKKYFILLLFYVYECIACMYVSAAMLCSTYGSQKRVSDPREVELQIVVSHHVDAGN